MECVMRASWGLVLGALAMAAGATGCEREYPSDKMYGPVIYEVLPDDPAVKGPFVMQRAYVAELEWEFLDLGPFNPVPQPMYVLTFGGQPLEGQWPIIDNLTDTPDYSPFWRVIEVEVPSDYTPNQIKSLASLEDAGWDMVDTETALYCPLVDPDAQFFDPDGRPLRVFWGTGEAVPNPHYGALDPRVAPGTDDRPFLTREEHALEEDLVLQPLWYGRLRAFCLDRDLTRRYRLSAGELGGGSALDAGTFNTRYVQLQAGDPEAMTEPAPWPGLLPVFGAGRDEASFHPVVQIVGEITASDTQFVELDDFAGFPLFEEVTPLGLAQQPLMRLRPDPADLPAPPGQ